MAKKNCAVCDKEIGTWSPKYAIKDGLFVCMDCLLLANIEPKLKHTMALDAATIKERIHTGGDNKIVATPFNPTKKIEKYLFVDENNRFFRVGKKGEIFKFTDLLHFELLEDGETIMKGGLGTAIVGGLLSGGVGAIVGSNVGGKKSKATCTSMNIVLSVKNSLADTVYINFISTEVKKNGIIYKEAQESAQKCLSALRIIADTNKASENNQTTTDAPTSAVDVTTELQKFHELMQNGIITEDDFNAKKAQLLGL